MDPRDVEESHRIADAAPPLTPGQEAALLALFGSVARAA